MGGNLATIVIDGKLTNISEDDLCKGDVVVLQAGENVPADLKLIEAWELEVDEFEITGEIMPVNKKLDDGNIFLYMGSKVTRGAGKGAVVATGENTEFGRVLNQSWEKGQDYTYRFFKKEYLVIVLLLLPAFAIILSQSSYDFLVLGIYVLLSLLFIFLQNHALLNHWIVTGELKNLKRFNIQIRDPRALERMDEIDTICFDKTGVLTTRHMDVQQVYFADAIQNPDAIQGDACTARLTRLACALCHDVIYFEKIDLANPIDKALISIAQNNGLNVQEMLLRYPRIYHQPFDSEKRHMISGFRIDGQDVYFAKGDPAVILGMCANYLTSAGELKNADLNFWHLTKTHIDSMSQNGCMVIALATTTIIVSQTPAKSTFLCLLCFDNSLQPGALETIRHLTYEGKRSLLLTGDREDTAGRVGVACGLATNPKVVLSGKVIDRMGLAEVARQSDYCPVFARLLPSQKGMLIHMLRDRNHLVAMVGDGPNDGVALKVADISISFVKNSSPIARRLSKILINNLADIITLIESSNRIKKKADDIHALRALLIVILFLSPYLWAFVSVLQH